jgi:hypothetical protein
MAKFLPAGGASLQASDTTTQTADIRSAAQSYGQRGVFLNVGTGGSKVTPSFDGGGGSSQLLWLAAGGAALVLILVLRRKKK